MSKLGLSQSRRHNCETSHCYRLCPSRTTAPSTGFPWPCKRRRLRHISSNTCRCSPHPLCTTSSDSGEISPTGARNVILGHSALYCAIHWNSMLPLNETLFSPERFFISILGKITRIYPFHFICKMLFALVLYSLAQLSALYGCTCFSLISSPWSHLPLSFPFPMQSGAPEEGGEHCTGGEIHPIGGCIHLSHQGPSTCSSLA